MVAFMEHFLSPWVGQWFLLKHTRSLEEFEVSFLNYERKRVCMLNIKAHWVFNSKILSVYYPLD